jgi:anthranilate phosphoribosyltransferase
VSEFLKTALDALLGGRDLAEEDAATVMRELAEESCPGPLAAAVLIALRAKGETATEIRGLSGAMRELAIAPGFPPDREALDMVGTGGDDSGSFNISTGAALLSAACGIPVIKHGNRAVSSASGSADVLEELGLRLPLDPAAAGHCLESTGFTFLFAPFYHPAMKTVAGVRRAMGVRTVFNILGPLTNPAVPPYQMIGAYSPDVAALMADALAGMPIKRAFVIHGEPGWDEATPVGSFLLFDVQDGQVTRTTRDPAEWGMERCTPEALAGGDAAMNARCLRDVFAGSDHGPHRDALVLGAALALELTGRVDGPGEAVAVVNEALDTGAASRVLAGLEEIGHASVA